MKIDSDRNLDYAQWLAKQIEQTPGWELVAPVNLQTVCVRHHRAYNSDELINIEDINEHTLAWVNVINNSGKAFMTASKPDYKWMIRVYIGVESTSREYVEFLWALMQQPARL